MKIRPKHTERLLLPVHCAGPREQANGRRSLALLLLAKRRQLYLSLNDGLQQMEHSVPGFCGPLWLQHISDHLPHGFHGVLQTKAESMAVSETNSHRSQDGSWSPPSSASHPLSSASYNRENNVKVPFTPTSPVRRGRLMSNTGHFGGWSTPSLHQDAHWRHTHPWHFSATLRGHECPLNKIRMGHLVWTKGIRVGACTPVRRINT